MAISFDQTWGQCALNINNDRGVNLISDGKTLAMRWDHYSFMFSDFDVTYLEQRQDVYNIDTPLHSMTQKVGRKEIEVHLVSRGPVKVGPASALDNLFLNANDLSVDELLKLAYQKIDARAEAEG